MKNSKSFFKTDLELWQFLFWIEALRSGIFKQGRLRYQDEHDNFCCIGVGECIMAENPDINPETNKLLQCAPRGGQRMDEIYSAVIHKRGTRTGLITWNDTEGLSFEQIADRLMKVFKGDLENFAI